MVDLLWGTLSGTGASRVHTVRVVRVADLLQDGGELVYEGMVAVYGLPTDFELQHCHVGRRQFPEGGLHHHQQTPAVPELALRRGSTGCCAW